MGGDDLLLFHLDARGHFRLVTAWHLVTRVKVPAPSLHGNEKNDHSYPASNDDNDEKDDNDDDVDSAKKPARPKLANCEGHGIYWRPPVAELTFIVRTWSSVLKDRVGTTRSCWSSVNA